MNLHCFGMKTPIKKYLPHRHEHWEIICQLEGEVDASIDGTVYKLLPGDILLIPPNAVRSGVSKHGFRDLSLRSDQLIFSALAKLHDSTGDITALVAMIQRVLIEGKGDYESVAFSLIESVCRMIKQELGTSESPIVAEFKRIFYNHISSVAFSLTDQIEKTGYHPDHFRRLFKREVGMTPLQYLTMIRIAHAKQLLATENDFTVETVAECCGFADSFYFSTCFKKHTGFSPLAWKKQQKSIK